MHLKKLAAILSLQIAIITAFAPNLALAEAGFWPAWSMLVPLKIKEAALSTFPITVMGGPLRLFSKTETDALAIALEKKALAGEVSAEEKLAIGRQIQGCRTYEAYPCQLRLQSYRSTAFVIEGQVATAFHAIEPYLASALMEPQMASLSAEEKADALAARSVPAIVTDEDGSHFFTLFRIARFYSESMENLVAGGPTLKPFDAVVLSSPWRDRKGLTLAARPLGVGERYYMVGYGKPTSTRKQSVSVPDADGTRRVMLGRVLTPAESYRRQGRDWNSLGADLKEFFLKTQLFGDSDSVYGVSGAPVLNSEGEVTATLSGTYPDNDLYEPQRISLGAILFGLYPDRVDKKR